MPEERRASVERPSELLSAYAGGDRSAMQRLMPAIYGELREIAHRHMRRERGGHTLQTTALVHEAYLALTGDGERTPRTRLQFLALASRAMRNVLIDHARERAAQKRGGEWVRTTLGGKEAVAERAEEMLAIDQALDRLASFDHRLGRLIELRFFGGLTVRETADHLGVSTMTVTRDWRRAKTWLHRFLSEVPAAAERKE